MTKAIRLPIVVSATDASNPALENVTVAHCCNVWERVYQVELAKGEDEIFACIDAHKAYRRAMPPLSGHQSICDFIACTAHGMLIGAIGESCGTKLLYAAQVALGTVRLKPKTHEPHAV